MADKGTFIDELDDQISLLKNDVDSSQSESTSRGERMERLRQQRSYRIEQIVRVFLPDLESGTLAALARKLPGFVAPGEVAQMLNERQRTLSGQIEALRKTFDPASFALREQTLTDQIDSTKSDLNDVQAPFQMLMNQTAVGRLYEAGFDTPTYRLRWWSHPFLWYRDLKAAAQVCRAAGVDDWNDVRRQYEERQAAISTYETKLDQLSDELSRLRSDHQSLNDLTAGLNAVPATVLDLLQTRLRAQIESQLPPDIISIDEQIAALQKETAAQQESRARLMQQMTQLQQIRVQAAASPKTDVPDEYLDSLRQNRAAPATWTGTGGGTTVVNMGPTYSRPGLFDGMLLGAILDHFATPHYSSGFRSSSGLRAGWIDPDADGSRYRDAAISSIQSGGTTQSQS